MQRWADKLRTQWAGVHAPWMSERGGEEEDHATLITGIDHNELCVDICEVLPLNPRVDDDGVPHYPTYDPMTESHVRAIRMTPITLRVLADLLDQVNECARRGIDTSVELRAAMAAASGVLMGVCLGADVAGAKPYIHITERETDEPAQDRIGQDEGGTAERGSTSP